MITVSLFLGFPCTSSFEDQMKKINPQLIQLYVSNKNFDYLQQTFFEGIGYLGKFLEDPCYLSDLLMLEKNIYSILNKIVPTQSFEDVPLVLFAVPASPI